MAIGGKDQKIGIIILAKDTYPAFRVDIVQLFSNFVSRVASVTWVMRRKTSGPRQWVQLNGENYLVTRTSSSPSSLARIFDRVRWFWASIVSRQGILFGEYDFVQCRDTVIAAPFVALFSVMRGRRFCYWMSYEMEEGYLWRAAQNFANGRPLQGTARWCVGQFARLGLYSIALKVATIVFVQSDAMRLDVIKKGVRAEKVVAVPMGVNLDQFDYQKTIASADPEFADRIVILYVGSIDPARHMEVPFAGAARVLSAMPNACLVILGDRTSAEQRSAEEVFKAHNVIDQVRFMDSVPPQRMLSYVKRADVCLAPCPTSPAMLALASPTKLCEYLAMGSRVVANDHPDQSLVVKGCGVGILTSFSEEGFRDGIMEALRRGRLSDSEIRQALLWLRNHRDYRYLSEMVLAAYRDALANHG